MTTITCICFMVAWTPYTILAILYASHQTAPAFFAVLAPYIAKSSTCYNPIIYFLAIKRHRNEVRKVWYNEFLLSRLRHTRNTQNASRSRGAVVANVAITPSLETTAVTPGRRTRNDSKRLCFPLLPLKKEYATPQQNHEEKQCSESRV